MVFFVLITILVILLTYIFVHFNQSFKYWKERNVPSITGSFPFGSTGIPFFNKKGLSRHIREFYEEFRSKGIQYGGFYIGTSPALLVTDPELLKTVMTKDFQFFSSQGNFVDPKVDPLSANLFNMEGQAWKDMRAKLTPTFTSGKMKMMFHTVLACSDQLIGHVHDMSAARKSLDVKRVLDCFTTDVIGSCAFGLDCNSFENPNSEFVRYGRKAIEPSFRFTLRRFLTVVSPSFMNYIKLQVFSKDSTNFFLEAVKSVLEHREKCNVRRNDFMQLLLEMKQKSENNLTLEEITAIAFGFFLAGFETSSTTMTFCLYELAYRPELQEKIKAEIDTTLEKYEGKITYEAVLKEMKYLDQVVQETLRKHPPVPILQRLCEKDYVLPNGSVVQKGTIVYMSTLGLHRDEEYYSKPEEFDPDRFSDENKASRPAFTYLPFGEGPRACIGLRFAMMQTKVGLVRLLKDFKFSPHENLKYPMDYEPNGFILGLNGTVLLNVEGI